MSTVCGRDCLSCPQRQNFRCQGCMESGGKPFFGECRIVSCCHRRGYTRCEECADRGTCFSLRDRGLAAQRAEKLRRDRLEQMKHDAPILARWLWVLFWLLIPSELAGILTNDTVVSDFPSLQLPGEVLTFLCGLAAMFILWKLSAAHAGYWKAALSQGAVAVLSLLAVILLAASGEPGLAVFAVLPAIPLGLMVTYYKCQASAEVLDCVDAKLAEDWRKLWKWNLWLVLGLLGCLVLALVIPILGALAMLADAIGLLVMAVAEWVTLYRSAQVFRHWRPMEDDLLKLPEENP